MPMISFFPVDNGDMTLIEFGSGRVLLIDCNIREEAGKPGSEMPDVAQMLKERLPRDGDDRLYVDALLLSHPDEDHCRGMEKHFHLGPPQDFPIESEKVFVREIWSSPMVFRRASSKHTLCDDAKAFNTEARRRALCAKETPDSSSGDRILILGRDVGNKTDGLEHVLVPVGSSFGRIDGEDDNSWTATLLGPLPESADLLLEETLSKNNSSTILRISLEAGGTADACAFLTGGDADVVIWESIWQEYREQPESLSYDILQTPHHCSWRSLSHDSWSSSEDPEVSEDAKSALGQALGGAFLVGSCKPVVDNEDDPPCIGAKREYEDIAEEVGGSFLCVMEELGEEGSFPLDFEIGSDGPSKGGKSPKGGAVPPAALKNSGSQQPPEVQKRGGGRYA